MAYYDRLAKRWHAETGYHGGSLKRSVLNESKSTKERPVRKKERKR